MSDLDRADRIQRFAAIFGEMFRTSADELPVHAAEFTERLKAVGASAVEAEEAQLLYFQMREAFAPVDDERVAKLAYLVKNAPGAPSIEAAYGQLTDSQRAAFESLTAEDLGTGGHLEG